MEPEKTIVITRERIAGRVVELGEAISRDYSEGGLVMVGVLKGAFVFMADLVRQIDLPVVVDFVRAASYGADTESSGTIRLTKDIEHDIAGRDVLLVEDIVDTGRTLAWLREHISKRDPRSIRVCSLIDKSERRRTAVTVDYVGFKVEGGFLVGYGLDCAEQYRHLPEVYRLQT